MPGIGMESRKRRRLNSEDESRKQRGRPRVEGQDETAADRRRTQIRLAQRAYRARKESTITALQGQVDTLQKTIEDMSQSFLSFHDRVVSSELLKGNPALGQQLRQITEQFCILAKSSSSPSVTDSADSDQDETPSSPDTFNQLNQLIPANGSRFKDIGMGYVQFIEPEASQQLTPTDSGKGSPMHPVLDVLFGETNLPRTNVSDFGLFSSSSTGRSNSPVFITRLPTPPAQQAIQNVVEAVPNPPLKAPYTFSIEESTFSRRIHRASLERAYHLLSSSNQVPETLNKVFRLTFLYHTRESLVTGIQNTLMKDTQSPLEAYHTPFIHLGGAGTHFGKRRFHNTYMVKTGPIHNRARLQNAQTGFDSGMDIDFDLNNPDFAGEWFDSTDVEGFLEHMGLTIDQGAVFAEARVMDNGQLIGLLRQNGVAGFGQEKTLQWNSEGTDGNRSRQSSMSLFPELGLGPDIHERTTDLDDVTGWLMGSGDRTPDFSRFEPQSPSPWDPADALASARPIARYAEAKTRDVTLDVGTFIENLISKGICLGRAPGFRKKDVERALSSSIIQVV